MVFIHGLEQTGEAWELQKELSEHYKLFIPTLRGHGSAPKQEISLRHFANDVLSMLDQEGVYSAHFCGLSLGGVVVQEIHKHVVS